MGAPAKIAVFVAMLAFVFAGALWLGTLFGPNPEVSVPHPATSEHPHPPTDGDR